MHMADALLSPSVGAAFWAGTAGSIAYCSKKLRINMDEKTVPLMGVLGAFIFAVQMINFTIPATGSSGHLGGGMILAIFLGPHAGFLVIASVLTVQALFFADGGLLALGCNIWNLGIYTCFIAYPLIYRPLTKDRPGNVKMLFAALLSAVAGLQAGSFSVVVQTLLSGKSELPFSAFLLLMQPIHLGIGIIEGIVTAGVIRYVQIVRPEILASIPSSRPRAEVSLKGTLVRFVMFALIAGGVLSFFASTFPDGLEWSIEKVYGKAALPEQESGLATKLKKLQEKTAFLPDYNFKKSEGRAKQEEGTASWPRVDAGTSLSGILGALMVLACILIFGAVVKIIRKRVGG